MDKGLVCRTLEKVMPLCRDDPDFLANLESQREAIEKAFAGFDPPPTKFKMPPPNFIVYFVGGETGPVKIGWTQQPIKARLKCIQNGSPVKLHVLATANRHRIAEKHYHRQFAAHRLHGEWFERSPEIQAEIDRLTSTPQQHQER